MMLSTLVPPASCIRFTNSSMIFCGIIASSPILPTAAGPAPTGTAAAKATEATASTKTASAAEAASTPTSTAAAAKNAGEKHPEQKGAQRREHDDQGVEPAQQERAPR